MAHYTEPYNRKSNLVKLLVLHPLENLYTLSFGSSPQRGLKAWYPVGTFGAAPREKYGSFSENVGKNAAGDPTIAMHHPSNRYSSERTFDGRRPEINPSGRTFEGRRPEMKLIWTDVRGPNREVPISNISRINIIKTFRNTLMIKTLPIFLSQSQNLKFLFYHSIK